MALLMERGDLSIQREWVYLAIQRERRDMSIVMERGTCLYLGKKGHGYVE